MADAQMLDRATFTGLAETLLRDAPEVDPLAETVVDLPILSLPPPPGFGLMDFDGRDEEVLRAPQP